MHSLNYFLLDEGVFILFTHVFTWVKLVVTSLGEWNNQASSEAAAWKNRHDTEVEQECTSCVHLLGAKHSGITKFIFTAIHGLHLSLGWLLVIVSWFISMGRNLAEHQRLLSLDWMRDHILVVLGKLKFNWFWQLWNNICLNCLSVGRNDLGEVVDSVLHETLSLMKFIPELLLDSAHISPCVHLIGLNICNLILVLQLSVLSTFDILFKISFLWSFDNNLCYFLWGLNFGDTNILLESLLDDLTNGQVVDFLTSLKFSFRNWRFSSLSFGLLLLLDLCIKLLLLGSLNLVLGLDISLNIRILILGIVDNNLVWCIGVCFNSSFLSLGSLKKISFW